MDPIFKAVELNDVASLRAVLASGVDVDVQDHVGRTSLSLAVSKRIEIVRLLLEAGANPNLADRSKVTPLMCAAQYQSVAAVEALLKAGANPLAKDYGGHDALWHSRRRLVNFSLPRPRGYHGTVFLPRLFRSRAARAIAAAQDRFGLQ
jgi:ankyrin repeat protein